MGIEQPVTKVQAQQQACAALASLNKDSTDQFVQALVGIEKVTSQSIAGTMYNVKMYVANTNCKKSEVNENMAGCKVTEPLQVRLCSTTILSQPWLKQDPSVNAVQCQQPPDGKDQGPWQQIDC
ncbi:unnamed protein product [Soboliphyme baturini]|uniref:Cystatin domain-containing protein n=1 Tax=Soboliphyme baturini TaxID=241478 RepID=A0A183IT17_9BILA|nr:unnamed protein product [Soboliphyme baturini]